MALSTRQVGAATSGVAAATVRVGTGGRNVASVSREDVERIDFAQQAGLGDETLLRFEQDGWLNPDGGGQSGRRDSSSSWTGGSFAPIAVPPAEDQQRAVQDDGPRPSLLQLLRGIGSYEQSIRVVSPAVSRPGSVMNVLY